MKRSTIGILSMLAAVVCPVGAAAGAGTPKAGDAAAGKSVFARCAGCHSADTGANRLGPTLQGVVGRRAGSVPNYNYSSALKASGITWTSAQLDAFLLSPRTKVPGNKMGLGGLASPADRANVIAYLAGMGGAK